MGSLLRAPTLWRKCTQSKRLCTKAPLRHVDRWMCWRRLSPSQLSGILCVFARCEHAEVTPVGGWAIFSRRATRGSLHKMPVGVRYAPEQQSPFCTHLHPRKVMLRRTKRRNKEINEIWTGLCEPVRQNGRTGSQPSVLLVCVRLWVAACVMVGSGVFSE